MITGDGIPWRPGSHTERLAQILEDAAARSPDSPGLQGLRLGFYSELLAGHDGEEGFADVEAWLADSRARISLMENGDRALERAADFASSI